MISVQEHDFDVADEYQQLRRPNITGAIVTFVGCVRDFGAQANSEQPNVMEIQHYPGMTESVLEKVEAQAHARWPIIASKIIHRVGKLKIDEQIVFVGVSTAHRKHAFLACEYIIDILKTEAPFWKKEGEHWVDAKDSDTNAADKWLTK